MARRAHFRSLNFAEIDMARSSTAPSTTPWTEYLKVPQELEADCAAAGAGELGSLQGDAAQSADQYIGHRSEPQSQLVGAHRLGRGAVGAEVELAFLDAVLHVAAGAIELLIEVPGLVLGARQ